MKTSNQELRNQGQSILEMSTQKHTSGPWKFSFESIDSEWAIVTTASGSIIANVNSNQRQKANARLIAAAPDLLAALQETLVELGEYMKICPNDKALDLAGVIAGVRWALIKAEGVK